MICAICLSLGRPLVDDLDGDWARPAITVANGTALCTEHLDLVADWETTDGAGPSLKGLISIVDEPLRGEGQPDDETRPR